MESVLIGEVSSIRENLSSLARQETSNRRLLIDLKLGQESLQKSISSSLRNFRIEEDKRISSYVRKSLDGHYAKVTREAERKDEKERLKYVHGRVVSGGGQFSVDTKHSGHLEVPVRRVLQQTRADDSIPSVNQESDMPRELCEESSDGVHIKNDFKHETTEEIEEEASLGDSDRDMDGDVSESMATYERYQPPPPPAPIAPKTAPPKYPVRRRSTSAGRPKTTSTGTGKSSESSKGDVIKAFRKENDLYSDPNIERLDCMCHATLSTYPYRNHAGIDGTKLSVLAKKVSVKPCTFEGQMTTSMILTLPIA